MCNKLLFFCQQPLPPHLNTKIDFVDESTGGCIPKQFIPIIMKEYLRLAAKGGEYFLICHDVVGEKNLLTV